MGKGVLALALALGLMVQAVPVAAQEHVEPDEIGGVADDWFSKPRDTTTAEGRAAQQREAQQEKAERYRYLLTDSGFDYYMDMKTARWIPLPHSGSEYIADVWVRLMPQGVKAAYSDVDKYYLEHYYIRPSTHQVQFLCELEVSGRPDNAIEERSYSAQHWENLVPGSIEEEIYNGVMKHIKKNKIGGSGSNGMSLRDMADEYLRIAL